MWEILTMGVEGVFYGIHEIWERDPEHVDFTLGVLATA
jgi:hypothetical protein